MLLIPLVVFVTVAIILRIRKKIWNASGLKSKKLDTACHESSGIQILTIVMLNEELFSFAFVYLLQLLKFSLR